jgi:hypothetical protein
MFAVARYKVGPPNTMKLSFPVWRRLEMGRGTLVQRVLEA